MGGFTSATGAASGTGSATADAALDDAFTTLEPDNLRVVVLLLLLRLNREPARGFAMLALCVLTSLDPLLLLAPPFVSARPRDLTNELTRETTEVWGASVGAAVVDASKASADNIGLFVDVDEVSLVTMRSILVLDLVLGMNSWLLRWLVDVCWDLNQK